MKLTPEERFYASDPKLPHKASHQPTAFGKKSFAFTFEFALLVAITLGHLQFRLSGQISRILNGNSSYRSKSSSRCNTNRQAFETCSSLSQGFPYHLDKY